MLRLSFGLEDEANAVEQAVETVLDYGLRTGDIANGQPSITSTSEMIAEIKANLSRPGSYFQYHGSLCISFYGLTLGRVF